MPFVSRSQQRWAFQKNPKLAREFAKNTPPEAYDTLPEKVGQDKIHEAAKRRGSKNKKGK